MQSVVQHMLLLGLHLTMSAVSLPGYSCLPAVHIQLVQQSMSALVHYMQRSTLPADNLDHTPMLRMTAAYAVRYTS